MVKKSIFVIMVLCACFVAGCKKGYPPYFLNGLSSSVEINATLSDNAEIRTVMKPNEGFRMGFEKGLSLQELTIKTNGIFVVRLSEEDLDMKRAVDKHEIWLIDEKGVHSLSKKELALWIKESR